MVRNVESSAILFVLALVFSVSQCEKCTETCPDLGICKLSKCKHCIPNPEKGKLQCTKYQCFKKCGQKPVYQCKCAMRSEIGECEQWWREYDCRLCGFSCSPNDCECRTIKCRKKCTPNEFEVSLYFTTPTQSASSSLSPSSSKSSTPTVSRSVSSSPSTSTSVSRSSSLAVSIPPSTSRSLTTSSSIVLQTASPYEIETPEVSTTSSDTMSYATNLAQTPMAPSESILQTASLSEASETPSPVDVVEEPSPNFVQEQDYGKLTPEPNESPSVSMSYTMMTPSTSEYARSNGASASSFSPTTSASYATKLMTPTYNMLTPSPSTLVSTTSYVDEAMPTPEESAIPYVTNILSSSPSSSTFITPTFSPSESFAHGPTGPLVWSELPALAQESGEIIATLEPLETTYPTDSLILTRSPDITQTPISFRAVESSATSLPPTPSESPIPSILATVDVLISSPDVSGETPTPELVAETHSSFVPPVPTTGLSAANSPSTSTCQVASGEIFVLENWNFRKHVLQGAARFFDEREQFPLQTFTSKVCSIPLLITGVISGGRPGGLPQAIEVKALVDIPDLSEFGLESANDGALPTGPEFTLSGSLSQGQYAYIASEDLTFREFFLFPPTFVSAVAQVDGNDAIALYRKGEIIDSFGELGKNGTGLRWEYTQGFGYRKTNSNQIATVLFGF